MFGPALEMAEEQAHVDKLRRKIRRKIEKAKTQAERELLAKQLDDLGATTFEKYGCVPDYRKGTKEFEIAKKMKT